MLRSLIALGTLGFAALILFIAYSGRTHLFDFVAYIPGEDRTCHFLLLAGFTLSISWLLRFRRIRSLPLSPHLGLLLVFAFITIEEFILISSPHRNFDWLDLSCNTLGVLLGGAISHFLERHTSNGKSPSQT